MLRSVVLSRFQLNGLFLLGVVFCLLRKRCVVMNCPIGSGRVNAYQSRGSVGDCWLTSEITSAVARMVERVAIEFRFRDTSACCALAIPIDVLSSLSCIGWNSAKRVLRDFAMFTIVVETVMVISIQEVNASIECLEYFGCTGQCRM